MLIMPDKGSKITQPSSRAKTRGEGILDLVVRHNMVVLNNGSHTRIDPVTGASQALDVSICSTSHAAKFSWKTLLDYSGSDHLPILLETYCNQFTSKCRSRWIFEKANWQLYEQLTTDSLRPGYTLSVDEFTDRVITAAEASIPKTSGNIGQKYVVWWNPEVALAIKSRRKRLRALRRLGDDDPQKIVALKQFQEARSHCRKTIHEAKQSSWDAFVESINPDTPASQVWNNINKLQGKRQRNTISLNLETGHTNNGPTVANAQTTLKDSEKSTKKISVRGA